MRVFPINVVNPKVIITSIVIFVFSFLCQRREMSIKFASFAFLFYSKYTKLFLNFFWPDILNRVSETQLQADKKLSVINYQLLAIQHVVFTRC